MPDDYTIGDLARQDLYPDETQMQPPQNAVGGLTPEDWMMSGQQPPAATYDYVPPQSWLQKAGDLARRDVANYQTGGVPAMMGQLAEDSSGEQDLAGGFGGNIKGVGGKIGALADLAPHAPPFYSAVENAVQGAKQTTAPGQQWAGFLRNQPGVKPEELNTLKLGDLFDQTAVTKQDLLDHIAANKVQLGEVVKGGGVTQKFGTPEEQAAATARLEAAREAVLRGPNPVGSPEWEAATVAYRDAENAMRDVVPGWGRAPGGGEFQVGGDTKFSQYTLPGGENYREMLLTLPTPNDNYIAAVDKLKAKYGDKPLGQMPMTDAERAYIDNQINAYGDTGGAFKSSHFDEPNILAHVRYNDRVIDGKKTLFVEEVQSDWHQKGKREGYQASPEEKQALDQKLQDVQAERAKLVASSNITDRTRYAELNDEEGRLIDEYNKRINDATVPDAPFKTTWPDLAMKRVIRQAAEGGYDKVAWTPGSVQADRYDLSKHVDGIQVSGRTDARTGEQSHGALVRMRNGNDLSVGYGKDGIIDNTGASNIDWKGKHLSDVFGKDIAEKMMAGKSVFDADLKIGGEGMKGFYDQILPAAVNKIVKKAGGRVEQGDIGGAALSPAERAELKGLQQNWDRARGEVPEADVSRMADLQNRLGSKTVHTLDITPQLREMALKKGFPLFTAGGIAATGTMGDLAKQDDYQ